MGKNAVDLEYLESPEVQQESVSDEEIRSVFIAAGQVEVFDRWLSKRDTTHKNLGFLDASTFLSLAGHHRAAKRVRNTTAARKGLEALEDAHTTKPSD